MTPTLRFLLCAFPLALASLHAESPKIPDYWNDAAITARVDQGIERNRKSDAVIRVTDAAGNPMKGVRVTVEQIDSSFHFGANIFMLDSYPTPEMNRRYEEAFCNLFNAATVPFYWSALEPEPGKMRFAADSPFIARRPPPDRVVEFCEKHGLEMHGHPLIWNYKKGYLPEWLPADPAKSLPLWDKRIREIAERYGSRIHRWDAVNEVVKNPDPLPGVPANYERLAFSLAEKYFPANTRFNINETSDAWNKHEEPYAALIRRLLDDKARIGGIGLQFHFFAEDGLTRVAYKEKFKASTLLKALDHFAEFGLPIHISEITLASPGTDDAGLVFQAQVVRGVYRLWFSHPAVDSITWWNFPDGGAAPGEDKIHSGLITADLQPKPAYTALQELIRKEWRTRAQGVTGVDGTFAVRGFHGRYQVILEDQKTTSAFTIHPKTKNELTLQIPAKK